MALRVQDLLESHVISVSPETSLLDVHRLFLEEEISGAPVVDDEGRLVGVITASDLLRATDEERDSVVADKEYFRDLLPYSAPDWSSGTEDFQDRLAERCVEDSMTRSVLTIAPTASAAEAARKLRENGVHRLFVVDKGSVLGVISAFDLLRVIESV